MRLLVLEHILNVISSYPVNVTVLLVSNRRVPELSHTIARQVIVPSPRCSDAYEHGHCLPWEALRALRDTTGEALRPQHDYYMYLESDMEIPAGTFEFWKRHADDLFKRRLLLVPHRRAIIQGADTIETWRDDCVSELRGVYDRSGATTAQYESVEDSVYIQGCEPYTGVFLQTKLQYAEFLQRGYDLYKSKSHGTQMVREWATWGHSQRGDLRAVTHPKVPVFHTLMCQAKPAASVRLMDSLVTEFVYDCVQRNGTDRSAACHDSIV
jgi:hypothetical protein